MVVDSGSFDGCGEMLSAEFSEVEFMQCPNNVGFGRANNLGCEHVRGEVLLLLNPDTELQAGAIQTLLGQLGALSLAGVVAPRLLNSDGSLQTSCVQALPTPLNQALDLAILRRRLPQWPIWGNYHAFTAQGSVGVEAVSGACMLLRTETFRRVGGFSPQFFMYGEDMDLCAKIRKAGLTVYHVPHAKVIHHGGGSTAGEFSRLSVVLMRQSVFLFILAHHGLLAAAAYRFVMAVSSVVRVLVLAPAGVFAPSSQIVSCRVLLKKWWAVLRWSTGLEFGIARHA